MNRSGRVLDLDGLLVQGHASGTGRSGEGLARVEGAGLRRVASGASA